MDCKKDRGEIAAKADQIARAVDQLASNLAALAEELNELAAEEDTAPEPPDPGQVRVWIEDLEALGLSQAHYKPGVRTTADQLINYLKQWRDLQGGWIR